MSEVFILWHSHPVGEVETDDKLIGVYATEEDANRAIERIKVQPGFRNYLSGFQIDRYTVGEDHWTEGYAVV